MTGRTRLLRAQAGLTLIELLLSASILSVVAVGVGATLAQTPRLTRTVTQQQAVRAAMLAVASQISGAPFSSVGTLFNGFAFDVPGVRPQQGDADGKPGSVRFGYGENGNTDYYKVTITVAWWDGHANHTEETVQWLANVRGDTGVCAPLEFTKELYR